jgi:hypothetical protein
MAAAAGGTGPSARGEGFIVARGIVIRRAETRRLRGLGRRSE